MRDRQFVFAPFRLDPDSQELWCGEALVPLRPKLLAQRRTPARLLVLATYRPTDVIVSGHPLKGMKQELLVRGQCEELALRLLREEEVTQYLAARFPGSRLPPALGAAKYYNDQAASGDARRERAA